MQLGDPVALPDPGAVGKIDVVFGGGEGDPDQACVIFAELEDAHLASQDRINATKRDTEPVDFVPATCPRRGRGGMDKLGLKRTQVAFLSRAVCVCRAGGLTSSEDLGSNPLRSTWAPEARAVSGEVSAYRIRAR